MFNSDRRSKIGSMVNYAFILLFTLTTSVIFSSLTLAAEKSTRNVQGTQQQIPTLMVNINKASAEEIADVMNGVGLIKAMSIVEYRTKIGSFKTLDELMGVRGIGKVTLEKNRHKLKL